MSKVNLTQQQLVHDRIRKVVAIALVILMLFSLRLIDLQAVRAAGFVERAQNELTKSGTLLAPRGTIYDINGIELARSVSAINIAVDQLLINDPQTAANLVAPILGVTPEQLEPELTGVRRYVLIDKYISLYSDFIFLNYNKTFL